MWLIMRWSCLLSYTDHVPLEAINKELSRHDSWGCKESDTTERLIWFDLIWISWWLSFLFSDIFSDWNFQTIFSPYQTLKNVFNKTKDPICSQLKKIFFSWIIFYFSLPTDKIVCAFSFSSIYANYIYLFLIAKTPLQFIE